MSNGPLVMKFGGTSVGEGAAFRRAARIAADAGRERPTAVVVSAMAGTTDTLLAFARKAASEAGPIAELHRALTDRHLRAARAAVSTERLSEVEERLLGLLERLVEDIVDGPTGRAARRDAIASFGERLSAEILAGAIGSLDVPSEVVAEDPIATDLGFGEAEVDAAGTRVRCSRHVAPLLEMGTVAVVPGYVGNAPDGSVTTLGRGGSDLSATVLGRALGSREVWIFSDVDGVLSADPRLVPEASLMPRLSYREAGLFAGLGAKVLHPRTMEPAEEAGMEVRVRNTFDLGCVGTRVSGSEDGPGLRCVALRRKVPIDIPCGHGRRSEAAVVVCIGRPESGDLARGVRCLREAGIAPLHSGVAAAGLVFAVSSERAEAALRALHAGLVPDPRTRAGEVA